jgi:putative transcriptional regulator
MGKAFDSIMRGLEEIKAHDEGRIKLKTRSISIEAPPRFDAKSVKKLRSELRLSQNAFADVLGVSKKTVEAWESGRNEPSGSACRLLEVISKDKNILKREKILVVS